MTEASMGKIGCAFVVLTVLAVGWSIFVWMAFAAGFTMYRSPDLLSREEWINVLLRTSISAFGPLVVVLIAWLACALAAKFLSHR
jgi:hypothetical protein